MSRTLAVIRPLTACAAAIGGFYLTVMLAAGTRGTFLLGLFVLIAAAAAWALGGAVAPPRRFTELAATPAGSGALRQRAGWIILLVACTVAAWAIPSLHERWAVLLPIWITCGALVLVGAALIGARARVERAPRDDSWTLRYLSLFAGCLAIGIAFRLYRIASMPPGLFVDETNGAMDALRILDGQPMSPFGVGWYETPSLYAYFMAALFKIGGVSFPALKAVSLFPAILTVAAIYPVGCLLFGARVGVLATFLLAVSCWHITLSRWGWNALMPPLFQLVSTALLLHAFNSRRALHFVLAGLILGLGMYTYLASRLVVGVIFAYLFYRSAIERGFLRTHLAGLLLFVLSYLLCFGPLCYTYLRDPFTFLNRSREVSILRDVERAGNWSPVWENAKRHLLMFHAEGDHNPRHNLPGTPMLGLVPGVLLILGCGLGLRRTMDHRFALLVIWIIVPLFGGILSAAGEGPQAYRTLAVVPGVCLLAAVTLDAWLTVIGTHAALRAGSAGLVVAGLGYTAYGTYYKYFVEEAGNTSVWGSFSPAENAVARRLLQERQTAGQLSHVYLSPRLYNFSVGRFLLYRPQRNGHGGLDDPEFHVIEPQDDVPLGIDAGHDVLMLLDVSAVANLSWLTHYYPHASSAIAAEREVTFYDEVSIPPADILAIQGLTPVDDTGNPIAAAIVDGHRSVSEWLMRLQPRQALVGALKVPSSGLYGFQLRGPLLLEIDGTVVGTRFLGKGLHQFRVTRTGGEGPCEIRWQPPGQTSQPLDRRQLFRVAPPRQGLRGTYYANADFSGTPIFERVDPVLSFSWPGDEPLPGSFSVRWRGQLRITAAGTYAFQLECDDGCALALDGQTIASELTFGVHTIGGARQLETGMHDIEIKYFQDSGAKGFKAQWAPLGKDFTVIPDDVLIPSGASSASTGGQ